MFTNVSWMDYSMVIVLLGSLYYLLIGLRYYPTEIKELLSGKRKLHFKTAGFKMNEGIVQTILQSSAHEVEDSSMNATEESVHEVEFLIAALKDAIEIASKNQPTPQEFSKVLAFALKDFPQLQDLPFRTMIQKLILSECEKYGTFTLSEEEIARLWDNEG